MEFANDGFAACRGMTFYEMYYYIDFLLGLAMNSQIALDVLLRNMIHIQASFFVTVTVQFSHTHEAT